MMSTPPAASPSLMARIAATEIPDLVVMIGYGDELPVYRHARALWQFYAAHFPNIQIVFTRWSTKLAPGEVVDNGYDLLVGMGEQFRGEQAYDSTGVWSGSENAKFVYRQVAVQDYLLRTRSKPFFCYQLSLTSVVDFRVLSNVLRMLPASGCYAGPLQRLNGPEFVAGLTFVSGASTLFSSDALMRMRERYDPEHAICQFPNDVWQALVLEDYQRIVLPTFNFLRPRAPMADDAAVRAIARQQLQAGHYHFRVKTVAPQDAAGRREDVDPWIMLRIMETILASEPAPEAATLTLMQKYAWAATSGQPGPMPSRFHTPLFRGARDIPFNDEEVPDPV
ncbi:MAG: hypothetical protein K2P77_10170 [Burkholderiaceae bacterium]|jgi:hypothetical protein|nr:hypothetical protein [Burkholderiaceae bacterium]